MAIATMNQAFFVVGHANWGKSKTLSALTNGSSHVRTLPLAGRTFRVGRMSNDDKPPLKPGVTPLDAWQQRILKLQASGHSHLLLTLCPNPPAIPFLRRLGSTHRLYFWVIESSFSTGATIPPAQIAALGTLGAVSVLSGRHIDSARAAHLTAFISAHP